MQSLCGMFRLVTKQTLKSVHLNQIVSVETNSLGHLMDQHSWFSSQLHTSSALILNKSFGDKIISPTSSKNDGIASSLPSYRCLSPGLDNSASLVLTLPVRNMTTSASTSLDVSSSSDVDPVPRIKFKRLDKTGRNIMQILDKEAVEEVKAKREIPDIRPGYTIQLKVEVPENKRRVSTLKGTVIARRNAGLNTTFRLRRIVSGVGIESLFPLYSPNIKEIKVLDKKRVRRAKIYYIRKRTNARKKQ